MSSSSMEPVRARLDVEHHNSQNLVVSIFFLHNIVSCFPAASGETLDPWQTSPSGKTESWVSAM